MKTAILADGGSATAIQQAQEHGMFLPPLQVIDEEHSYQDDADISTEELYKALRKQYTPKTSMPVGSIIEAALRTIKEQGYEEIVSVPLLSGFPSTSSTIRVTARRIGTSVIHIEDLIICDLQGHEVLLTERYVDKGKSDAEINEFLSKLIRANGTLTLSNDTQHLKRGGRLIPLVAAAANLLKIKPVLTIDPSIQGKIDVLEKVRTERKVAAHAVNTISKKLVGRGGYVYVIHPDCLEKAKDIRRQLLKRNSRLEIRINTISAIITAYTGLDCIVI